MSAAVALRAAEVAGVVVAVDVDDKELLLEAPSAPPPVVIEAVFQHRVGIARLLRRRLAEVGQRQRQRRHDVDLRHEPGRDRPRTRSAPAEWAEALARLSLAPKPEGFGPRQWDQILADAEHFVATWAGRAAPLGWSLLDVFGMHLRAPAARYDGMGLVPLLRGGEIVALDGNRATIRMPTGSELTYLKRPKQDAVAIWELAPPSTNKGGVFD